MKVGGIMKEEDYPYRLGENAEEIPNCDERRFIRNLKIWYVRILDARETSIPKSLYLFGPIAVLIYTYPLIGYQGGIMRRMRKPQGLQCQKHWVLLVGCTHRYWKFKNSYGSDWGENGYFRLERRVMEENMENLFLSASNVELDYPF